jgi:hypothetical protein
MIVVNHVAWVFGVFFSLGHLKEVGLIKIMRAYKFLNNFSC